MIEARSLRRRLGGFLHASIVGWSAILGIDVQAQVLRHEESISHEATSSQTMVMDPDGRSLVAILKKGPIQEGVLTVLTRDADTGAMGFIERHRDGVDGVDGMDRPRCASVSPDGAHLYVGGDRWDSDTVAIFRRDIQTAELEYIDRLPDGSGVNGVTALAFGPGGVILYAAGRVSENIVAFARNPVSGLLTEIQSTDTSATLADGPIALVTSPDGAHLYAATDRRIGIYSVAPATGQLSYLDQLTPPSRPFALATSHDGAHLLVVSELDNAVVIFERDPIDGGLTFVQQLEDGTGGISSLGGPQSIVVEPSDQSVLVSARSDDTLTVFDRDPVTGMLTLNRVFKDAVNGVRGLDGATTVLISPDGQSVYVLGTLEKAIARLERDGPTGELAYEGLHFDGLDGGEHLINTRVAAVSPDGKFVYTRASNDNRWIAAFRRSETDGHLSFAGRFRADVNLSDIGIAADGAHLYATDSQTASLQVFGRDLVTGELEFVEQHFDGVAGVQGLYAPISVTLSPDGANVYVAGGLSHGGTVAVFDRDPATGSLTFIEVVEDGVGGVDGLDGAISVVVSPDGANAYVAGEWDDAIAVFSRNVTTGSLSFVEVQKNGTDGVFGIVGINDVAISPDGLNIYAAGTDVDSVAVFTRNPATGELSYLSKQTEGLGGVEGLTGVRSTLVSPTGEYVYAAGFGDNAVVAFVRVPGTGALRYVEHHSDTYPSGDTLTSPSGLATSPDGASIYVVGSFYSESTIAHYRTYDDLNDGTAVGPSSTIGWSKHRIVVPVCADALEVSAFDLSRNAVLYTRAVVMPSSTTHDCVSDNPGTEDELCVHNTPTPGTWWVAVVPPPTGPALEYTISTTIGGCDGDNLVSWWRAEDNTLDSAGPNHGIAEGGLTYADGISGRAFQFDGLDDGVLVPYDPSLDAGTRDLTVSYWIKTDDDSTETTILDWRGTSPLNGYRTYLDHGRPAVQAGDGSRFGVFIADQSIADGRMHHVAIVSQRTSVDGGRILIDGRRSHVFDLRRVDGSLDNASDLTLGRSTDSTGGTERIDGLIDELKLFHRALPLREAVDGLGSLVGWWPADGTTQDRGGTNHGMGDPAYTQGRWVQAFGFGVSSAPVTIPNDPSLEIGTGALAISCWIWSAAATGELTILDTRDAGGVGFRVSLDDGRPAIAIDDGAQSAGFTSDSVIADGDLHHLVFSIDRDNVDGGTIFIDAQLDSTFDPTPANGNIDTLEDLTIGRDTDAAGGQSPFIGGIDDLQLHSAPMTQTQVEWLFGSDGLLFLDGFETANISRWAVTIP